MNSEELIALEEKINNFFDDSSFSKVIRILSWKFMKLSLYIATLIFLSLAMLALIEIINLQKTSLLIIILLIIFIVLSLLGIITVYFTKKTISHYNKIHKKHFLKSLQPLYLKIINENLVNNKLTKISSNWSIHPYINFYYQTNINNSDNVLLINNNKLGKVNLGTLTYTSNIALNKNLMSSGFNPYNINQYQYFIMVVTLPTKTNTPLELIPLTKIAKKDNYKFENFYLIDLNNIKLEHQIVKNITISKLIPTINLTDNKITFCFATVLTNNIRDSYDGFFSLNFSLNKKELLNNTKELIEKDLKKIQSFLLWLNLSNYIK